MASWASMLRVGWAPAMLVDWTVSTRRVCCWWCLIVKQVGMIGMMRQRRFGEVGLYGWFRWRQGSPCILIEAGLRLCFVCVEALQVAVKSCRRSQR